MAHAQATVIISKPAATVFNFLADGTNNPKWQSHITTTEKITPEPIGVGSRFKQIGPGTMGRPATLDYEITVYVPNQLIAYKVISGATRPEGRYMLSGDATMTSVTYDLQLPPKSFIQKFFDKKVQEKIEAEVRTIQNIKPVLEQLPSSPLPDTAPGAI